MVVLVRCCNDVCVPALESHLNELISNGLITAFLRDGTWIPIELHPAKRDALPIARPQGRMTAMVSSF